MLDVAVDELLEAERLGPAVIDGQRIDGETVSSAVCLYRLLMTTFGNGVPLDLDHDAGVLVGLVAHRGDVGDDLFIDQVGDALDQHGAVHVVGNFRDDDLLAAALELLDAHLARAP